MIPENQEYTQSLIKKARMLLVMGDGPFENYLVVDGVVVGFVQKIAIEIEASKQEERKMEITFPKLDNPNWEGSKEIERQAQRVSGLKFADVKYCELKFDESVAVDSKETSFESSDKDFQASTELIGKIV